MLRIGLTGGIACGKSTVAQTMRKLGCAVLEADLIAHEITAPGQPAYDEIVREFGSGILAPDKSIDRTKLGPIAFADKQKMQRLEAIIHPRVLEETNRRLDALEREGEADIAVVAAALHYEAGYTHWDRMVVVWCTEEQQVQRLAARGLSRQQALERIRAQIPLDEKRRRADDVIDASGSLADTRRQTEALVSRLRQLARA